MTTENNPDNCPDYLPKYVAIDRFSHWVNHAQLDNKEWDRFFAIAAEHGFDVRESVNKPQGNEE